MACYLLTLAGVKLLGPNTTGATGGAEKGSKEDLLHEISYTKRILLFVKVNLK